MFQPDELRLIALAAPSLDRMLERRIANALTRIHATFREGKTDQTAAIAELVALRELQREINSTLNQLEGGNP